MLLFPWNTHGMLLYFCAFICTVLHRVMSQYCTVAPHFPRVSPIFNSALCFLPSLSLSPEPLPSMRHGLGSPRGLPDDTRCRMTDARCRRAWRGAAWRLNAANHDLWLLASSRAPRLWLLVYGSSSMAPRLGLAEEPVTRRLLITDTARLDS